MADKRILKRNIRFWGKAGLQLTSFMLIFMVVYGFLFYEGTTSVFESFWKTAYFYGGIISVLFALIGPICYVGSYLPMVLSFGSGRKEAAYGAQIFSVVYVLSAYIIMIFTGYMCSGKVNGMLDVLIAELFVLMTALGQLISVAQMHYGMKSVIMGVLIVAFSFIGGIAAGIGFFDTIPSRINGLGTGIIWTFLGIGAVVVAAVYGVSLLVLFREMKRYAVKA